MFCDKCEVKNDADSKFCKNCGNLMPVSIAENEENKMKSAAKNVRRFQKELFAVLDEAKFITRESYTAKEVEKYRIVSEEDLPENVFRQKVDGKEFFVKYHALPQPEVVQAMILLIAAKDIKTTKNCIVFFTVIFVITLILSLVQLLRFL